MTKISMTKTNKQPEIVLDFEHLNFEFVSDFGFRASNFPFILLRSLRFRCPRTGANPLLQLPNGQDKGVGNVPHKFH